MRLIAFLKEGKPALAGRLDAGDGFVDLSVTAPHLPTDLRTILADGSGACEAVADALRSAASAPRFELDEVTLLPPVAAPSKIVCLGLNYIDHAAEGGNAPPEHPALFMRGPSSLVAHGQPIMRPTVSSRLSRPRLRWSSTPRFGRSRHE